MAENMVITEYAGGHIVQPLTPNQVASLLKTSINVMGSQMGLAEALQKRSCLNFAIKYITTKLDQMEILNVSTFTTDINLVKLDVTVDNDGGNASDIHFVLRLNQSIDQVFDDYAVKVYHILFNVRMYLNRIVKEIETQMGPDELRNIRQIIGSMSHTTHDEFDIELNVKEDNYEFILDTTPLHHRNE